MIKIVGGERDYQQGRQVRRPVLCCEGEGRRSRPRTAQNNMWIVEN